jgi:hypothetical protein
MSRILKGHIVAAERKLAALKRARLEARVATLFREQPYLLSFIAELSERGVSQEGIQFLYRFLAICHQAAKESARSCSVGRESRPETALYVHPTTENRDTLSGVDGLLQGDDEEQSHSEFVLRSYVDKAVQKFVQRSNDTDQIGHLSAAAFHIADSIAAAASNADDWSARRSFENLAQDHVWRMI